MCKQHAKSDVSPPWVGVGAIVGHEFWDDTDDRRFQFEEAALVEDHRHRGCGNCFRDRRNVEQRCGFDVNILALSRRARREWRTLGSRFSSRINFIREMAKCLERDQAIPVGH